MKISTLSYILSLTLFAPLYANDAAAHTGEHKIHWGYEGAGAPANWGKLDPKYHMCSEGVNQSPINIDRLLDAKLPELTYDYKSASKEVVNNGHAIQVNFEGGSTVEVDGIKFELKQYHFHSPSENNINGKSFPLEAHFVHLSKDGQIAVVAVMFEEGAKNDILEKIWEKMPMEPGKKVDLKLDNALELLPKDHDYYRFNGSLTTPPCTEGVRWIVLKKPATLSKEQIEKFKKVMGHPNNRPLQPLDARVVIE